MADLRIIVTGATGTLGKAVINSLLQNYDDLEILGISRDEQKQRLMPKDERLKMRICDIRDQHALYALGQKFRKAHIVFHFAALKCVDTLEENPVEAYKTNVQGTQNVCWLSKLINARLVMASTDKAVYPINTYGCTKALAERLVLSSNPDWTVCRYGNVLGSRGSFLQSLEQSLIHDRIAYLTDERMTRFWMPLQDARDFVLDCAFNHKTGLQVPEGIKSSFVIDLIHTVAQMHEVKDYYIKEIGVRPGEKLHETLYSYHEFGYEFVSNDHDVFMSQEELAYTLARAANHE